MKTGRTQLLVITLCLALSPMARAMAQVPPGASSSLMRFEELPPSIEQSSPLRSTPIPPRRIQMYDIIAIRVDELARTQSDAEVNRRKTASINAVLLDWITLNGFRQAVPDPQTNGDQTVQGQLTELYRAENEVESTERMTFNIAAQVVDIRPNGNIVLEARKETRNNNEVWSAKLSGICRQQDIGLDNVLLSRNIVDLKIEKNEVGHVRDTTRRGWLMRLYDFLHPF